MFIYRGFVRHKSNGPKMTSLVCFHVCFLFLEGCLLLEKRTIKETMLKDENILIDNSAHFFGVFFKISFNNSKCVNTN